MRHSFCMPVITLSTDIGLYDYLTGAIKGQLLSVNNALTIADITHTLTSDYQQVSYVCRNAFKYFPKGTFHILLVNLFETSPKRFLISTYEDQYILCPDNGILTMICGSKPERVFAVGLQGGYENGTLGFTQSVADTIGQLTNGKTIEQIGEKVSDIVEKYPLRATIGTDWLEGQIIFVDKFENVIVNITKEEFEEQRKDRQFHISFMRNESINSISENYASVPAGEKLAWFNAAGYLEISVNKGNMAGLFGLRPFSADAASPQNKWFYQTVRIYFNE